MKAIVPLTLILAALFAAPAAAGIGAGNGEIGCEFGSTDFDSNVTAKSGSRFDFRGGYHFTKRFELEGQSACSGATERLIGDDLNITLCAVTVNGVLNFHSRGGNIVPYILGGVGRARLKFDGAGSNDEDTGSASQAALGSRFFFGKTKRVAFRFDYSVLREKAFGESSIHRNLVLGFTWRLGKGK
jgi:hypothetical protein